MLEWGLGGLGGLSTVLTGWMIRTNRKVNEHSIAIAKIPVELEVAILKSEKRQDVKFEKVHESIADLKETVLIQCGRTD